jgi:hypothetical protein
MCKMKNVITMRSIECKVSKFSILCQISCNYICHLSKAKGTIFLQQECYYIGESGKGEKGRLGTNYI